MRTQQLISLVTLVITMVTLYVLYINRSKGQEFIITPAIMDIDPLNIMTTEDLMTGLN